MNVLGWIEDLAAALSAIGADSPPAPRWDQDWFPRLDAAAAYAIVRMTRPARIVEVGSGHSTRFLARAVRDGQLAARVTAIDPAPRATIGGLDVQWVRQPAQSCSLDVFELAAGDILFIDSSHQLTPGSDVEFLFERVLPRLARGVRIHFHDIFLPDEYPAQWAWRRYNEQAAVAALIGEGYALEFSSHQAAAGGRLNGVLARLPLVPGAMETSLWLTKR
ncbi:MAG TPA: class I SAM-dependent methyltransferase [Burkholderiales bacterium]|nr:class I SAM-dependent methyltransferase [Burkholderiales bacterium]